MKPFDISQIIYEDNHLLVINKRVGQLVQGDKTGDISLNLEIKTFLKEKYQKPGNVFCGVIHRLDRPTSGLVVFAKTSKALERMNVQFQQRQPKKIYHALVEGSLKGQGELTHRLLKNEPQNKSYVVDSNQGKQAVLRYQMLNQYNHYTLVKIELDTGRHHQIRCQMAHLGHPLKGDLKYGAKRANDDHGICLHSAELCFIHPVSMEPLAFSAPLPEDGGWIK
ncbi:MAG: RluA family pseudouridine synthase [Bacteroidetes bacterium]|nr:RluA family pseudouridine synthase [Bacteroidota bacterium]MBM3423975.1 RluA family pseudouridine synthase [Bacteroidota bacterium]